MKKSQVGGQAVMEGVMMKAPGRIAIAVRKSSGEIELIKQNISSITDRHPLLKKPVIRGIVTFGETMVIGIKSLLSSAELFGEEEGETRPSKFETFIAEKTGKSIEDVMIFFALTLGVAFAILLFFIIPTIAANFLRSIIHNNIVMNLIEGAIRITVFVGYITIVSRLKDIQRVFEYHGAEHKTIHCYEHEEELCVENAKKYTTLHPRCGTAFMLIVMVISIVVFTFLGWQNVWMRIGSRIIFLPLVAGISYEIIKWAGRTKNRFVDIIMFPGLMLQKLTTREPDDAQLEVAIKAFLAATGDDKEDIDGNVLKDNGHFEDGTDTAEREGYRSPSSGSGDVDVPSA